MNIINTKKSEEKLEINDEDLLDFYESKKNLLCPRFKIPKSFLKTISLDNYDDQWLIDYCKMITSKKVNRKAYLMSYFFNFLFLSYPLLTLCLMIYLWIVKENSYWWIPIIFVIICMPLHYLFECWIFSNKKTLKKEGVKRSKQIGLVMLWSHYLSCIELMTFGLNEKDKNEIKKKIIKNCFNNIYQFIDDDDFKKLKFKNINFTKRKYKINCFFIVIHSIFSILIHLWPLATFPIAIIYTFKQMLVNS